MGEITAENPGFINSAKARNRRVQSLNSVLLKGGKLLCEQCNSNRTQEHDQSWDTFSDALARNPAEAGDVVFLNRIFPAQTRTHRIALHLYVAKKLGCALADHGHSDQTKFLADAIMAGRPCRYLYLQLQPRRHIGDEVVVGETHLDIWIDKTSRQLRFAQMAHNIAGGTIEIAYACEGERQAVTRQMWQPKNGNRLATGKGFSFLAL